MFLKVLSLFGLMFFVLAGVKILFLTSSFRQTGRYQTLYLSYYLRPQDTDNIWSKVWTLTNEAKSQSCGVLRAIPHETGSGRGVQYGECAIIGSMNQWRET